MVNLQASYSDNADDSLPPGRAAVAFCMFRWAKSAMAVLDQNSENVMFDNLYTCVVDFGDYVRICSEDNSSHSGESDQSGTFIENRFFKILCAVRTLFGQCPPRWRTVSALFGFLALDVYRQLMTISINRLPLRD